jgi:acetylornithine/succinyldiaminopimelate/putrescine aminotransferase
LQKGVVEMVETRRQWAMDSRGRGLVRGLTLWDDPRILVDACRERGLAIGQAGENSIVFAPPLVADAAELAETLRAVSAAMESRG